MASLALLGLLGTAEARLGETEQETWIRYKRMIKAEVPLADPKKYYSFKAVDVRRDTVVQLVFDKRTERCVFVSHTKIFENNEDMNLPFRAAEGILEDNFGDEFTNLKMERARDGKRWDADNPEDREYEVGWRNKNGEKVAFASSKRDAATGEIMKWEFAVNCSTPAFDADAEKGWAKEKAGE